jgi:thymidine phosphorylase
VLEFDRDIRGGDGFAVARDILDSGRALAKMNAIIDAQGRIEAPPLARLTLEIAAPADGTVTAIDCETMARIARLAGAPKVKGAGVDLLKKLGERVMRGEALYRLHAETVTELEFAREVAVRASGFTIGTPEQIARGFVEF